MNMFSLIKDLLKFKKKNSRNLPSSMLYKQEERKKKTIRMKL